ncbi:hypothetical protein BGZ75_007034 [Mortierella antarctica]|nr:hypothetical protein BGZ75_007034 [Mortierella antarctica]
MSMSYPKDRDTAGRRRKKGKERDPPRLTAHSSALEASHAYSETSNSSMGTSTSRTASNSHSFTPSQQSVIHRSSSNGAYPSSQESVYHAEQQLHYSSSSHSQTTTDPRSSSSPSYSSSLPPQRAFTSPKSHDLAHHLGRSFQYILSYLWDLVLGTLLILRPIFSFLLALVIILGLLGALTRSLVVVRTEFQARVMCKIPGLSHFLECPPSTSFSSSSSSTLSAGLGYYPVPDFADLINKQVAAQELFADSLNALHPDLIKKKKDPTRKGGRQQGFVGRIGKNTRIQYHPHGQRRPGRRDRNEDPQDDGEKDEEHEEEDEEEDPYGLMVLLPKSGGKPLPLLLKQAELATVDLKVLVSHSRLPKERKDLLKEQLEKFHVGAKATSRQMQFLQVEANAYMDVLRIKNVYLIAALDRLEQQQRTTMTTTMKDGSASGGGVENEGLGVIGGIAVLWDRVWDYFTGSYELQTVASEQKLQLLYQTTMEEARTHIRDLIVQAQDLLQSKLGGNRLQRGLFEENLGLLQDIGVQRKLTVGQIQTALLKLTDFEAEIGVLRERVVHAVVGMSVDNGDGSDEAVTGSGSSSSSSSADSGQEGGGQSSSSSSGSRVGTSTTLRAHIEHIMRVTDRMKERSFLADTMVKNEKADQKPVGSVAGDEGPTSS